MLGAPGGRVGTCRAREGFNNEEVHRAARLRKAGEGRSGGGGACAEQMNQG